MPTPQLHTCTMFQVSAQLNRDEIAINSWAKPIIVKERGTWTAFLEFAIPEDLQTRLRQRALQSGSDDIDIYVCTRCFV